LEKVIDVEEYILLDVFVFRNNKTEIEVGLPLSLSEGNNKQK
jgi:hypothetical protein